MRAPGSARCTRRTAEASCALTPGEVGQPRKELRTFGTMTDDLERLADWLAEQGVGHVALESTGSYWKPVLMFAHQLRGLVSDQSTLRIHWAAMHPTLLMARISPIAQP